MRSIEVIKIIVCVELIALAPAIGWWVMVNGENDLGSILKFSHALIWAVFVFFFSIRCIIEALLYDDE